MQRPALEVADIFRDFGSAWLEANRGHVSHAQLKVMNAIGACRTAALGGYVAPVEVLSSLFRGRMLAMLSKAHAAGRLEFFGDYQPLADTAAFKAYLAPLWKTDWFVYAKRPFAGP